MVQCGLFDRQINSGLDRNFREGWPRAFWVIFLLHRCSSTHGWTSGRVIIFSNLSHLWLQVHVKNRQTCPTISINPEITAGQPASPCRTVKKTMTSTYLCRRICHLPVRQEMWWHVMKCHPLPWSLQDSSRLSARSMDHHGKQPAMMTMMMTTNRRSKTGWRPFQHRVVSASCGLQTVHWVIGLPFTSQVEEASPLLAGSFQDLPRTFLASLLAFGNVQKWQKIRVRLLAHTSIS